MSRGIRSRSPRQRLRDMSGRRVELREFRDRSNKRNIKVSMGVMFELRSV